MTPLWQTKGPSNIINTQGSIDVSNILGSNTLVKLVKETGIPLETFVNNLGIPSYVDTSLLLNEIGLKY